MKKRLVYLVVVIFLVTVGWVSNAVAAAQTCDDAVFLCYDRTGAKLGEVSVTCSLQVPFNDLIPRCLPNFDTLIFPSVSACKKIYPASFKACPREDQHWPSGYGYSHCENFPTF